MGFWGVGGSGNVISGTGFGRKGGGGMDGNMDWMEGIWWRGGGIEVVGGEVR